MKVAYFPRNDTATVNGAARRGAARRAAASATGGRNERIKRQIDARRRNKRTPTTAAA